MGKVNHAVTRACVTTHSIRYRILKADIESEAEEADTCYNPFDPIQDTESGDGVERYEVQLGLQPIRSDTGY